MTLNVPMLGYTSPLKEIPAETREANAPARLIVGWKGLTLDGQPFPWATAGDWIVTIPEDGLVTLTVQIVITLPADPDVQP